MLPLACSFRVDSHKSAPEDFADMGLIVDVDSTTGASGANSQRDAIVFACSSFLFGWGQMVVDEGENGGDVW